MDSKKRKCMLVAAILNIAALVMVIVLIAVCSVSVASASLGGGDFYLGENPKTTTAYNGYHFNLGPDYDDAEMLVLGANDKLLFVKFDEYGPFVIRNYTTNCTIDARNEVISIKDNSPGEDFFYYGNFYNSSITILVGGRSFEYWSYDSEQNMIGCVMGYKIYNVLFDETMLEDFNIVQGASASTTTVRLIVNKRAFCTNNNLSNIPEQLFREDISENTNIDWYGCKFYFYNFSVSEAGGTAGSVNIK